MVYGSKLKFLLPRTILWKSRSVLLALEPWAPQLASLCKSTGRGKSASSSIALAISEIVDIWLPPVPASSSSLFNVALPPELGVRCACFLSEAFPGRDCDKQNMIGSFSVQLATFILQHAELLLIPNWKHPCPASVILSSFFPQCCAVGLWVTTMNLSRTHDRYQNRQNGLWAGWSLAPRSALRLESSLLILLGLGLACAFGPAAPQNAICWCLAGVKRQ